VSGIYVQNKKVMDEEGCFILNKNNLYIILLIMFIKEKHFNFRSPITILFKLVVSVDEIE
jgi:hypothetical protein